MKVILEGCDGTGKSTLAKKLAEKYHCDILAMTAWGTRDVKKYFDRYANDDIISDRCFISEVVYSKALNKQSKVSDEDFKLLMEYVKAQGFKIIVLNQTASVLKERLKARGDESEEILNNVVKIQAEYMFLANEYNLPIVFGDKDCLENISLILEGK